MVVEWLHREPNAYLSTILIFNTVAIIMASSAATLLAIRLYQDRVPEWLVSLVLSLTVLVLCEITPKTISLQRAERVALRMARLGSGPTRGMRPGVFGLTAITGLILRMLGGKTQGRSPFL